ncbi:hypothetical protein [Tabrizicola sp.]|jgi:hypothetical protein|uniref:hypothetical protein n=1 Tax=Tabrizicola sp. TaxID=2005166 RepID=UPI0025D08746|nr:hypothetical protein [Tabrizicola sp.]MBY0351095.1 hypothetical protein [Tabrizicola sp.]MDK2774146.1 hypothetical protein [Tabrizicola sp.]
MTLAGLVEMARFAAGSRAGLALGFGTLLSGCAGLFEGVEGTVPYSGPDSVIATAQDYGRDNSKLTDGKAAIAYDPDGCQVWIIDDGLEGYSSPRFDPKTGLPVCDGKYPPGTVIGVYETADAGVADRVSGPAAGHRQ